MCGKLFSPLDHEEQEELVRARMSTGKFCQFCRSSVGFGPATWPLHRGVRNADCERGNCASAPSREGSSPGTALPSRTKLQAGPTQSVSTFSSSGIGSACQTRSMRSRHRLESSFRFSALSHGMITGLAWRITRQAVPRLWPFTCLPRLGDPSEPSLAPQTAEPLAPCSSNPVPDHPAGRPGASP